jgi:hypothetical protein
LLALAREPSAKTLTGRRILDDILVTRRPDLTHEISGGEKRDEIQVGVLP